MTRTPSPLLRERALSFFSNEKSFCDAPTLSSEKREKKRGRRNDEKNARRSFRRARRRRRCALVSFASRFVRFLFLFARIGNAKTVCLVFFELLLSLSLREKRQCRLEKSIRARAWSGERCDQNAREKKTTSRRVPFLSNEFDAQKEFVCACVRAPKSSRGKRARVWQKTLCGDCFPLKKRKISWLLPLFCPLCSFFFLFWARFFLFFGKKWREILVSQFRVLVFSVYTTRYGLLLPYV